MIWKGKYHHNFSLEHIPNKCDFEDFSIGYSNDDPFERH